MLGHTQSKGSPWPKAPTVPIKNPKETEDEREHTHASRKNTERG